MNGRPCTTRLMTVLSVLLLSLPAAAQTTLTLFNGLSLTGWTQRGPWTALGGILATNGSGARSVTTAVPFADAALQFEYNQTAPVGAKVRLFGSREGSGGVVVDLDFTGTAPGVGGVENGLAHSRVASVTEGWHRVLITSSHGTLSVSLDGAPAATASGLGARAGYISFEASGSGQLQLRSIRLTPENPGSTFNNTDLGGWKSVAHQPGAKGGVGHTVEKTLTFGMAGGSTKPHSAKWTVKNGAVHGEDGPGGLEYGQQDADVLVQLSASVRGDVKGDNYTALGLRVTPGQLGGGYAVGLGPYAGTIENLVKGNFNKTSAPVDETVVFAHRTIAIWLGGQLRTVYTDPRPESGNAAQGARTAAGAISLLLPNKDVQLDVQHLMLTSLKGYGAPAAGPPPPAPKPAAAAATTTPAATVPVTPTAPAAPSTPSVAEKAILQQQENAARKDDEERMLKQRTSALMAEAIASPDPARQAELYTQVVQIDPANAAAVQGARDAQAKVQAQQEAQQRDATNQVNQQRDTQTREQQSTAALARAQGAFLAGRMSEASQALGVAERLSPNNPLVHDLRTRINATNALHSRLYFLAGGAGLLAGVVGLLVWVRRRKQQRYPVLEVTEGLDAGRRYPLDKDIVRIGAIAQDGGQRNDIVVRDVEHSVSRFHCEVSRRNGELYVTDLRSSNGTRVNGDPIEPGRPAILRKGSKLQLGGTVELRLGYDSKPVGKA